MNKLFVVFVLSGVFAFFCNLMNLISKQCLNSCHYEKIDHTYVLFTGCRMMLSYLKTKEESKLYWAVNGFHFSF